MWKRWQTIRLLPLFIFLVACGSPSVVHMVHPQGGDVSCDTKNWDGCYKWNCLDGLAARQHVRNCVALHRNLGYITQEEMKDRKERQEGGAIDTSR